jgi:hypothetical protein
MHAADSAWEQFIKIMFLPDNIPIVGMLFLVMYFTYLAFREGRKNDQMIAEGRPEDILKDMQQ